MDDSIKDELFSQVCLLPSLERYSENESLPTDKFTRIYRSMKNGHYDDLSDEDGVIKGLEIADVLDLIYEGLGVEKAITAFLLLFNGAYVHGQEIRDQYSPLNQLLFRRYKFYLNEYLKPFKNDPVQGLCKCINLVSKNSGNAYPRSKRRAYIAELLFIPMAEEAIKQKAEAGDISALDDIAAIAMTDVSGYTETIRIKLLMDESTQTGKMLERTLHHAIAPLCKTAGWGAVDQKYRAIIKNKDYSLHLALAASKARRRQRGLLAAAEHPGSPAPS